MILNQKGGGRKSKQNDTSNFNVTSSPPIANSTVMGTSNVYLNDTEQFLNDPFQQSQQYYQPQQPVQQQQYHGYNQANNQNGFFEMPNNNYNNNNYNTNNVPVQGYNNLNNNSNDYFNTPFATQKPINQPAQFYNPLQNNNLFNDPVASMAVKYGTTLADQGKEYVAQNVDRWFSISKLKYYFAVDTSYVARKLLIILFPFINRDWSIKYSQTEAVPPKLDINAPDMYIPFMAFVTYILIVGVSLGTQNKFSPELLGIQASSALGWYFIEVLVIFISLQVLSIKSVLKTFDIIAFCGYKYFGMILCLLAGLVMSVSGYRIVLIYSCISLTYFMVRNLKLMILSSNGSAQEAQGYQSNPHGNKRRIYVLLFISLLQPLFMWWLTRHLIV